MPYQSIYPAPPQLQPVLPEHRPVEPEVPQDKRQEAARIPTEPRVTVQYGTQGTAAVYAPINRPTTVFLAPFYLRTYAQLVYFLCFSWPLALFSFVWVTVTFCTFFGLIACFLVGLPLLVLSAYTWRALAHLDVAFTKVFCPPSDSTETVILKPIGVQFNGCWGCCKANLCNSLTVRSILYFTFLKLPWATFTWSVVLSLCSLWAALLAYPVLFAMDLMPRDCDQCSWFLTSGWSSIVAIPCGIIAFYITTMIVHCFSNVERCLAWSVLGQQSVNASNYAQFKLVEAPTNGAPVVKVVIDNQNPSMQGTYVVSIPAMMVVPYARKSRGNCLRTLCGCLCCGLVTLCLLVGAAVGMISLRCSLSSSTHIPISYELDPQTTTERFGVELTDLDFVFGRSNIRVHAADDESGTLRFNGSVEYLQQTDGEDWHQWFNLVWSDGFLTVSTDPSVTVWQKMRLCPKGLDLDITIPAPHANQFIPRPLQVTSANTGLSFTVDGPDVGAALKKMFTSLNLKTSNSNVKLQTLGTYADPVSVPLTVSNTNAGISADEIAINASLLLETSNSGINVHTLSVATDAFVRTSNSGLRVDNLKFLTNGATVNLGTSNSKLTLGNIVYETEKAAQVTAQTSNSILVLNTRNFQGEFSLETSNSGIDIYNHAGSSMTYTANSRSTKKGIAGSATLNSITGRTSNSGLKWTLM